MPRKATTIFSYCAALTVGLASMAAVVSASSHDAQARATGLVVQAHVAAGWGNNGQGQLGDGTLTSRSGGMATSGSAMTWCRWRPGAATAWP